LSTDEKDDHPIHDLSDDDDVPVHDLVTEAAAEMPDYDPGTNAADSDAAAPVYEVGTDDGDAEVLDMSSSEDREAVLAEALAHAAMQDAQYMQPLTEAKPPGRWKTPLAMVVFAMSAYLLTFPPPWLAGEDPPAVSRIAREQGVRAALFLQAQQIEAFRIRQGRLPRTLEETEGALGGIQFVRSNARVYQLVAPGPDGPNIIYDSSRPTDDFLTAATAWGARRP